MKLGQKEVDTIFAEAKHQRDYVVGLYKVVFPRWDKIENVNGFPHCGEALHSYTMGKAIEFDKLHHPKVMNGGLWMNSGFSIDRGLGDWEFVPCKVTYLTPVAT